MVHNKTFIREDGSKVQIIVTLSRYFGDINYRVEYLPVGGKNWLSPVPKYLIFHKVTPARNLKLWHREYLKYVTKEEILEAKLEFWEKFKSVED